MQVKKCYIRWGNGGGAAMGPQNGLIQPNLKCFSQNATDSPVLLLHIKKEVFEINIYQEEMFNSY